MFFLGNTASVSVIVGVVVAIVVVAAIIVIVVVIFIRRRRRLVKTRTLTLFILNNVDFSSL